MERHVQAKRGTSLYCVPTRPGSVQIRVRPRGPGGRVAPTFLRETFVEVVGEEVTVGTPAGGPACRAAGARKTHYGDTHA